MESRMKNFFCKNKIRYAKGATAIFCINFLQVSIPKITGNVIDGIQAGSVNSDKVLMYSSFIVVIAISIFLLNYLSRMQIMGASMLFQYETSNEIFKHLEKLSMSFFSKKSVGELMALSVNDVSASRLTLGRGVNLILDTFFLMILSISAMAGSINMKLTILAFLPMPVLLVIIARFGGLINKRFKRVQESFSALTEKSQENISGIRVIKAFVQEKEEIENFKEINNRNYKNNMDLVKVWGVFYPLIEFCSAFSYLMVLVYGSSLVLNKQISIGDFIAVNSYIGILVRPIRFMARIINIVQRGNVSSARIENLLKEKVEINDETDFVEKLNITKLTGKVQFNNLSFSYNKEAEPVLKNISFSLEPGKTTAVVGRIGCGKTTLANLILRLYNTEDKGQLLVDEMDISEIPLKVLRENIGYVPQENFLFSQSIKDNIAFSEKQYSMKEVEEASKISQVYDNIMDFQEKFNTILGERGVNISGGQKQRVSIARAIIKKPSILILDDCLSAVDTETEKNILYNLKKFIEKSSCLIVSHRISSIIHADEIIVLEKGSIVERGTHEELMKTGGIYYRMYEKQILEEKMENSKEDIYA